MFKSKYRLIQINHVICKNALIIFIALLTGFVAYSCSLNTFCDPSIVSSFSIVDGFQIELVAMEPLISDPVAMEIDENGQVYIVEMHGYPLDLSGSGAVKKLYDDDADGVFDRSVVFYDGLVLPTGIMRWKQGVLVADPPDLLYLEDTDGDNKADKKEVILTGFALSNPQHNFNSPIYGLDNWIYLANEGTYKSQDFGNLFGDEGQEIHFPDHPDAPRLPRNANDLNVRVNLYTQQLEMLSGDSQYGHTFNRWGHHFLTKNWSHIYHEALDSKYIARNKDLVVPSAMQYVPDYGIGFDLFPITEYPQHQMLTDVGVITSACGITWYLGDLFPEPYNQVIFTAEPTHNLVHTDIIYHKEATFASRLQFESKEFLASTDSWFRPVNFYIGPDGALYVLDYYRKIIEHPEWISEKVVNSGELYEGIHQGRMYKILPRTKENKKVNVNLGQASTEELIQLLEHPNIWWRRNAQRLLVDRQEQGSVALLQDLVENGGTLGVLHGLWTLEGLAQFNQQIIFRALEHDASGIRENAIKIAELHRHEFPGLEQKLISMVEDTNKKVRFQLLCTLGYYDSPESTQARKELLFSDLEDPWVQLAALSASSLDSYQLWSESVGIWAQRPTKGAESLIKNLSMNVGRSDKIQDTNGMISEVTDWKEPEHNWWRLASMEGLAAGVEDDMAHKITPGNLTSLKRLFADQQDHSIRFAGLNLLHAVGYYKPNNSLEAIARQVVVNQEMDAQFRADALKVLAWSDANRFSGLFENILDTEKDQIMRVAALNALEHTTGQEAGEFLIGRWQELLPPERDRAVNVLTTSDDRRLQLLRAVDSGQIQSSVLGWGRTVRLLNSRSEEVRASARKVLEGNETISDSIWQQYQETMILEGDALKGAEIFNRSCAVCHQLAGQNGINFGPDLATVRNRNKSGIMIDILKPNRSISDGYELWTIEDKSGQFHTGIVTSENTSTLTIRNVLGEEMHIQQQEVAKKTASEISAMPEGLHNQISPQQMSDLLEYIMNVDRTKTSEN